MKHYKDISKKATEIWHSVYSDFRQSLFDGGYFDAVIDRSGKPTQGITEEKFYQVFQNEKWSRKILIEKILESIESHLESKEREIKNRLIEQLKNGEDMK